WSVFHIGLLKACQRESVIVRPPSSKEMSWAMLRLFTHAFHPFLLQGLCQERGGWAGIKVNNFQPLVAEEFATERRSPLGGTAISPAVAMTASRATCRQNGSHAGQEIRALTWPPLCP